MFARIPAWSITAGMKVAGARVRSPAYAIPGERVCVLVGPPGAAPLCFHRLAAVEVSR